MSYRGKNQRLCAHKTKNKIYCILLYYILMVTNQNRLSPYLGFLLYFHKSQSYTLCNYTYNFKMFKTYHSEVI